MGKIFLLATSSRPTLGLTLPPIQQISGEISSGVNSPTSEIDHSSPSRAEVKKGGAILSLPNMSSWTAIPFTRTCNFYIIEGRIASVTEYALDYSACVFLW
jgi:hypothetical protein